MALLEVTDLSISFHSRLGRQTAVDGVSFSVEAGQMTAIIGESGSGKSVSCYSLLGLIPQPPGHIDGGRALFQGRDLLQLQESELRRIRGRDIAMVFQDPMTCLNPYMTIGAQVMEPLRYHTGCSRDEARKRALTLLDEVGIRDPQQTFHCYPHEFSGGMRQRVMIAMALINEPKLLIADEPTTALDVTIQAQILALITELQTRRNIGVILISHDLAVVADVADQIVVMESGQVVERGTPNSIFKAAQHPYTQSLLNAIPSGSKQSVTQATSPLLTIRDLRTWFQPAGKQPPVKAVDGISFDIHRGEVLGLVGESGSGKSTVGRSLLRLVPVTAGSITFDAQELVGLARPEMTALRRRMQMIFQDPFASLNPRMTVFDTLSEPLLLHRLETRQTAMKAVLKLMDAVGLPRAALRKYPHEFSGGQRQRIAIGRALATRPEFVVADEPVSALDVTIQAQILDLLLQLGAEYKLTLLFISHDLAVVRQVADRVMVMQKGSLAEIADTEDLFRRPQNAYTQKLISAIPGAALGETQA